jgi:hypothetical protein
MRNIFVSYSHQDSPKVKELLSKLKDIQVSGWLDHADISAGHEISTVLRDSLRKSSAILVLISPASLRSQWVEFEISAGQALGKTIIPIIIGGEGVENNLPPTIADITYIDAREISLDEVASKIKRAVIS